MGRGLRGVVALAVASSITFLASPGAPADEPTVRLAARFGDLDKGRAVAAIDAALVLPAIDALVVEVPASQVAATARHLRRAGASDVEVDPPVSAARVPDDPVWPDQWGPALVRAPAAWERTTGSPSTVVAVLDTGVSDHADLPPSTAGIDLVNGDDVPDDDNGHGTAVAGILGATGDNGMGVAGYCWSCALLPVKVLDADGNGDSSTVAAGIVWAVDHGASIVNLSLSSPSSSFPLSSAVAYAADHGVVVVAAAGNDGLFQPSYPASYPGVLGVIATDPSDQPYEWSNRGRWASVAAPGCHRTLSADGGYAELCGTSSAAPAIAGIAALARSAVPAASAAHLVDAVRAGTVAIENGVALSGRVDAPTVIERALRAEDDDVVVAPAGVPSAPRGVRATSGDRSALVSWSPPSDAGAGGVTSYVVQAVPGDITVEVGGSTTSATVSGLFNGSTYRFTVAAHNVRGTSLPSSPTGPVTPSSDGVARVAGEGRVLTAVALSQAAFATADAVVIARRDDYADALTAAPLAARLGGPLLLSGGGDTLEAEVGGEIRRLGASVVHLVGGSGALSVALEDSLASWGVTNVVRTAGRNRFDTARLIALQVGGRSVYVTNGIEGWPDAVAGSGLASVQGRPILLVSSGAVPSETRAALTALDADAAVVVGGTGSVAESLLSTLRDPDDDGVQDVAVTRIAGDDRYETSRRVADVAVRSGADASRAWLASGESWPDALASGPALAARGGVLLLIHGRDLESSPGAAAWLGDHAATLAEVVLVGGGASIDANAERQVLQRLARL